MRTALEKVTAVVPPGRSTSRSMGNAAASFVDYGRYLSAPRLAIVGMSPNCTRATPRDRLG